jgi:chaperonin cofactor prefoldin
MALKKRLKKLDEVDEKVRGLYVQQGDEFVLDLDDPEYAEMRKKVEEFRTNNIQLSQQREQLEAQMKKFEGIDPGQWQEAKKALDTINQIEEKDLIKGGKFDEVVNRRLQAYRQDVEKQTKDLNARIESLSKNEQKYRGAYAKMKVETEVGRAIQQAASIRQGAMDDVMNRVQRDWNVNDKDELLVKDLYAPHLFEAGTGGGAGGGNKQRKKEAPATVRPDSMGITTVNGDTLRDIAAGKVRIGAPVGASSDDGE